MTFDVTHFGLYFTQADVDNAQSQRDKQEDLQSAWQWLLASSGDVIKERKPKDKNAEPEQVIKPDLDDAGQLINATLRYRLNNNHDAGEFASQMLMSGFGLSDSSTLFETITTTLLVAHAFEMLRDNLPNTEGWLARFATFTDSLSQAEADANTIEQFWLLALKTASAIVLEDKSRFDEAITSYKEIIDTQIHPEGYFKPLSQMAETKESAFREMVLACAALTLTAEMATHAGENLWNYENRDVGLNTSITYLVYYYFYPDKWRWGNDDLTEDHTQAIFADLGAWIEISTRRVNPRGVELLLDDQRPFFNAYMGGLTTLTHFKTERPKRFGIFG
ncbi:MAG: alginate lyase family protein [Chloroflexota bacterium]